MENFSNDFQKFERAKKQVKEIKDFYAHALWFVFGMAFMIFINLKYSPQYLWFLWSLLGWGIGLFFHGARVFNWFPFMNKDWEEKKIKQFMEEEDNQKRKFQ